MKSLFNKISTIKEVFSLEDEENEFVQQDADDILNELESGSEKAPVLADTGTYGNVRNEDKILDFEAIRKGVIENEEEKNKIETLMNYQTIFVKPTRFEDSKKVANYINQDKIVTLNLEEVDNCIAQRIIDFLSGAMSVKEAQFVEVSKRIYVSVPKKINVLVDGTKSIGKGETINFDFG